MRQAKGLLPMAEDAFEPDETEGHQPDAPSADGHTHPDFPGASGVLFEQAMAQTRMAVTLADPEQEDLPLVFVNRSFLNLTGYEEHEVLGRNCRFLQGPGTDPAELARLRKALEEEQVVVVELLNYRKDGTPFWNALHIGPIYHADGRLRYIFGSQWDVSDLRSARADEAAARMMEREISHRMKNMFAVITSVVTMTGQLDGVPVTAEKINSRIRALGRAHQATLDMSFRAGSINPAPLFHQVIDPYLPRGAESVTFSGEAVDLDSNLVTVSALILHELAANATKHGAFSRAEGTVEVDWHMERRGDANCLILFWRERGGPRLSGAEPEEGAGAKILRRLLKASSGAITRHWRPEGLECEICLPADDLA